MQRLVQLKHYAIFPLIFIAPVGILFLIILLVKTLDIPILNTVAPFSLVIIFGGWFSWMYSAGIMLHKRLYDQKVMNVTWFKLLLIFPVIYLLLVLVYGIFFDNPGDPTYNKTAIGGIILIVIGLGFLIAILCLLYSFYFVAKCLRIAQYQRKVFFKEYADIFFLFWILPVGLWIIQPKMNKIFSEDSYEIGAEIGL